MVGVCARTGDKKNTVPETDKMITLSTRWGIGNLGLSDDTWGSDRGNRRYRTLDTATTVSVGDWYLRRGF